ncbi:MAG: hypothetical protein LQ348_006539, partial [Seirophora lacunosa]
AESPYFLRSGQKSPPSLPSNVPKNAEPNKEEDAGTRLLGKGIRAVEGKAVAVAGCYN